MNNNLTVIIMAGGEGKRMKSNIPKVLHNFHNKPIIVKILNEIIKLQPTKIIIITGKYDSLIKEYILRYTDECTFNNLIFVNQPIPQGTGDAIKQTLNYFDDSSKVLIINGDMPLIKENTLSEFVKTDNNVVAKLLVAGIDNPFGYGRIIIKDDVFVSIREEKDCSHDEKLINIINTGIYCFSGYLLKKYIPLITNQNNQHEYYLTDIISIIKQNTNINIITHLVDLNNNYQIMGVNTKEELEKLEKEYD